MDSGTSKATVRCGHTAGNWNGTIDKEAGHRSSANRRTYGGHDILVDCKVGLAVLASEDLVRLQVDVVLEPHWDLGFHRRCGGNRGLDAIVC